MAWVWSTTGLGNTYNKMYTNGAEAMWALIDVLMEAGWDKVEDSDGSTYSSSGDQVVNSTFLNATNAWVRMQDPAGLREIIIQRGGNAYTWKLMYSASSKFIGGTPSATVVPTATDEQGWAAGDSTTAVAIFKNVGPYAVNVTAQSAAQNGVYPFWMIIRVQTSGLFAGMMIMDAFDKFSSSDQDPVVMAACNYPLSQLTNTFYNPTSTRMRGWMKYNDTGEWGRISLPAYSDGTYTPNTAGNNPHDAKFVLDNALAVRSYGTILGPKGKLKNLAWRYGSGISFGDVIEDDNLDVWLCADYMALKGWPDKAITPIY